MTDYSNMSDRELDLLIETKLQVRGTIPETLEYYRENLGDPCISLPRFTSEIRAAMQVLDEMMRRGFRYVLRGNFQGDGLHVAQFDHQDWVDANPLFQSPLCKSRSRAICEAAMSALEDK